jgi:hypothetical protein
MVPSLSLVPGLLIPGNNLRKNKKSKDSKTKFTKNPIKNKGKTKKLKFSNKSGYWAKIGGF